MWKKLILENKFVDKIRTEVSTIIVIENNVVKLDEKNFGVISLLENYEMLSSLSAITIYDKLIGKGAAMIMSEFNVEKVFAKTITKKAYEILSEKCSVEYDRIVENILNRDKSDLCPIEKIASETDDVISLRNELTEFYIERGYINV